MKNLPVCRLFLSHLVRLWDLQFPKAQSKDMNNENINKTAIFFDIQSNANKMFYVMSFAEYINIVMYFHFKWIITSGPASPGSPSKPLSPTSP